MVISAETSGLGRYSSSCAPPVDLTGSLGEVTKRAISEVERLKVREVLQEAEGNKGRAAELLQISYKSLLAKIKEHAIE